MLWLTRFFRKSKLDAQLDSELRFHVEQQTAENIAAGMTPDEARRRALAQFGGLEYIKEETRAARGIHFIESLLQDVRYALRMLRKSPGFAAVAVLTLALGIGANTAMFSALYGLVLQPLPYADASRLVMLWDSNRKTGGTHIPVMEGSFAILQKQAKTFDGMAAFTPVNRRSDLFAPKLSATQERVAVAGVSPQFFSVLGVAPLLGRTFTASEGVAVARDNGWQSAHVAILSYAYWRQHYGANPGVIGKTITLNRFGEKSQYTIVGVMPKGFDFPYPLEPSKPDIWTNAALIQTSLGGNDLEVVGRLKAGVSLAQAQAEIHTIAERIRAQYPKDYKDEDVSVVPLSGELTRNVRSILWVLLAAFGFILLIGCANVGNLLLVRAVAREKEMAIRATLGASRLALIRQMLAEAMLLALAGGALGLLLAYGSLRAFLALLPQSIYIPRLDSVSLDTRMLVLAAGLSVIAAAVFSVLPSLRLARPNLNETLKSGSARKSPPGRSVLRRPGSVLLVVEVSLALVLLTGALLMLRSMQKLLAVNGQFQPERLLSMTVDIDNAYVQPLKDLEPVRIHFQQFEQRIAALPGVEAVALTNSFPPVAHQHSWNQFKADSGSGPIAEGFEPADYHVVTPAYFDMMGMTLVRGRWFADSDTPGSLPVAVINEAMAKTYWRDSDPLGVKVQPWWRDTDKKISYEIVGIIHEPKEFGTGETPLPAVYHDYAQVPRPIMSVIVRTRANPERIASAMRNAASQIVPGHMFVGQVQTGNELISESSAQPRFTAQLLTAFSTLALLLAVVG
ncbi:MAG TPA: ABC transporter permease, partial [Candidatus Acidoferrales bacterium]|nr:ABC transporter permease [Candidatus Acidoferrales bacterium]